MKEGRGARILTTHAGRLDGPPRLGALMRAWRTGDIDVEKAAALVPDAIKEIVQLQKNAGVDVVSDGELGKLGFGLAYYGKRLTGLTARPVCEGEPGWMSQRTGERIEFADF